MTEKLPTRYRPCAGIVLLNQHGQVFVARRNDTPDAWQMPQGGIDDGEKPKAAALRELEEEISVPRDAVEVLAKTPDWLTYDLPPELLGKVWKGKYRGQKQKWFACRLIGPDSLINLETEHPEFDEWMWTDLEKIPDLIVPFKRAVYQQIVEQFRDLAN